jgi:hypothetical protein
MDGFSLFAASLWLSDLIYAAPLVVVVSLVYAATRQEQMEHILSHATRLCVMIAFFLAMISAVLAWMSWLVSG